MEVLRSVCTSSDFSADKKQEFLLNYLTVELNSRSSDFDADRSKQILEIWILLLKESGEISLHLSKVGKFLAESCFKFDSVENEIFGQLLHLFKSYFTTPFKATLALLVGKTIVESKEISHCELSKLICICEKELLTSSGTKDTVDWSLVALLDCIWVKFPGMFKNTFSKWNEFIDRPIVRSSNDYHLLLLHFASISNQTNCIFEKTVNSIVKLLQLVFSGVVTGIDFRNFDFHETFSDTTGTNGNEIEIQQLLKKLSQFINQSVLFIQQAQISFNLKPILNLALNVLQLSTTNIIKEPGFPTRNFELIKTLAIPQVHTLFIPLLNILQKKFANNSQFVSLEFKFLSSVIQLILNGTCNDKVALFSCLKELKYPFREISQQDQLAVFESTVNLIQNSALSFDVLEIFFHIEAVEEKLWYFVLDKVVRIRGTSNLFDSLLNIIEGLLLTTKNSAIFERAIPLLKNTLPYNVRIHSLLHVLVCPQRNPFQVPREQVEKSAKFSFSLDEALQQNPKQEVQIHAETCQSESNGQDTNQFTGNLERNPNNDSVNRQFKDIKSIVQPIDSPSNQDNHPIESQQTEDIPTLMLED